MSVLAAAGPLAELLPLFDDIGALKRIRRAGAEYSVGAALFLRAWRRAVAGDDLARIAFATAAHAIAASRLGATDGAILARSGLEPSARLAILHAAFDRAATALAQHVRRALRAELDPDVDLADVAGAPPFAFALAQQPRAGATAPDAPRLVLQPAESHADHCFAVCTYAVLAAPRYGTTGEDAFLLALGHHLHNAVLPDSGYAGEVLLGDRLEQIVEHCTNAALACVPGELAHRLRDVRLRLLTTSGEPEARAFHAADVVDRVLEVRHFERVARFETAHALDDLQLVHAGPIARFHAEVLAEAGLP